MTTVPTVPYGIPAIFGSDYVYGDAKIFGGLIEASGDPYLLPGRLVKPKVYPFFGDDGTVIVKFELLYFFACTNYYGATGILETFYYDNAILFKFICYGVSVC